MAREATLLYGQAQGRVYDMRAPSQVAILIREWIGEDGRKQKSPHLLQSGGSTLDALERDTAGLSRFSEAILCRHTMPGGIQARIGSIRGHLFTDKALEATAILFHDPLTKLELLKTARDADAVQWQQELLGRMNTSNTRLDFLNAMSMYFGSPNFADLMNSLHHDENLSDIGISGYKFSRSRGYGIDADTGELIIRRLKLDKYPEILAKFKQMIYAPEAQEKPVYSSIDRRRDELIVTQFNAMLKSAFEQSGIKPTTFFNKTVDEGTQIDPENAPIHISRLAATANLGSRVQWPSPSQMEELSTLFAASPDAKDWWQRPYRNAIDIRHPQNGKVFSSAIREMYSLASDSRERLLKHQAEQVSP